MIVILWAMEEGRNVETWPGYVESSACFASSAMHLLSVCVLSRLDRDRQMKATQGMQRVSNSQPIGLIVHDV